MTIVCSCGKRLNAKGAIPGRLGRCPQCGAQFRVPDSPGADASAPSAAVDGSSLGEQVAETDHVLPQRAGFGESFVATRSGKSKPFTRARAPVERCGLIRMPRTPERFVHQSFAYPFWDLAGIGWILTMSCAIAPFSLAVSGLANVIASGGIFVMGVMGLLAIALFLMLGYALAFLNNVIVESAMGEIVHPRWPDFDAFTMLGSWLPWCAGIVSGSPLVLPALVYALGFGKGIWPDRLVFASLVIVPSGYVMLSALAALLHGSIVAANPRLVLKALFKTGASYLKIWLLGGLVVALGMLMFWLLNESRSLALTLLGSFVAWALFFYGAMVAARALGVAYYRAASHIGWFPERQRWGAR
jgi:hypothetical protein